MCVIIIRDPGVTIPHEKLVSACHVNGDGYGAVITDRGKNTIIKNFDPKGNDPDKVAKLLDDAKDVQVALHLRFSTAGAKNIANCHPFISTTKQHDGIDIAFMHNGTIGGFSSAEMCDSYHFNEDIVRPMLQRAIKFSSPEDALNDDFLPIVLAKFAGTTSVLTLVDDAGNTLIINKDRGHQDEGWWASNKYSFDRTHRDPAPVTRSYSRGASAKNGYNGTGNYTHMGDEDDDWRSGWEPSNYGTNTSPKLIEDKTKVGNAMKEATKDSSLTAFAPPGFVQSFCELVEIESLIEVCRLEEADINTLVDEFPEMAVVLIRDLLFELFRKNEETTYTAAEKAA